MQLSGRGANALVSVGGARGVENTKLKSNVDVYMTAEMRVCAAIHANKPIHIILVSCDGGFCGSD